MKPTLAPVALHPRDFLPDDTLYVTDHHLNVVHVSREWDRFARDNDGERLLGEGWNPHLLDNFSGHDRVRWTAIYRALLDGRLDGHVENFACPSPIERRFYRLRITPRHDDEGRVAFLIHHAVRIDGHAGLPVPATIRAYRACIMTREVRLARFGAALHLAPLEQVGGDLMWMREYQGGKADVVLGDAMGHGINAARMALRAYHHLESGVHQGVPPSVLVERFNRHLYADGAGGAGDGGYLTGLFLRLDPAAGTVTACNFGHDNPIFSKGGHLELQGGMPVGLLREAGPWPEEVFSLHQHGPRFLTFTDGISEQFDPTGHMFGVKRLEAAFQDMIAAPLHHMLAHIVSELDAFRAGALVKDDCTLMALELKG